MRKSSAVSLLAAFAACALGDTRLSATVIPPIGLTPGSQYQLIFVTANGHDAESNDIAVYNAFVTSEAVSGIPSGLPSGATWTAVASTDDVDANVNAPSGTLPVYNTAGELVAAAGVGIYTGALDNVVGFDQYGDVAAAALDDIWTGSDFQGFGIDGATLGSPSGDTEVGQLAIDATWLQFGIRPQFDEVAISRPLYALSGPLTSVPEPSAAALLGTALLVIGGIGWLRRQR